MSKILQKFLKFYWPLLQELVDYLQKYLIENKSEWMEQHFAVLANDKVISKFSRSFSHKSFYFILFYNRAETSHKESKVTWITKTYIK